MKLPKLPKVDLSKVPKIKVPKIKVKKAGKIEGPEEPPKPEKKSKKTKPETTKEQAAAPKKAPRETPAPAPKPKAGVPKLSFPKPKIPGFKFPKPDLSKIKQKMPSIPKAPKVKMPRPTKMPNIPIPKIKLPKIKLPENFPKISPKLGLVPVIAILMAFAFVGILQGKSDPKNGTVITDKGIFLLGSQEGEIKDLGSPSYCRHCHQDPGTDQPYGMWRGQPHSHAGRDPLFLAALAVAYQDFPESGDWCLRCHSPKAWLEGRSKPFDGSGLKGEDYDGVTCDFCHRLVDPKSKEGKTVSDNPPQAYADGMYLISPDSTSKRGPFSDGEALSPGHKIKYSQFHSEAELCGTCHDITNPVNGLAIERTYSEWKGSWFAENGVTCQECHMGRKSGYSVNPQIPLAPKRDNLPMHDMTGGSTWLFDALPLTWEGLDIKALKSAKSRAEATLKKSAKLDVTVEEKGIGTMIAKVKVINLTGHKLPTGYPEGRRMWLNVQAYDKSGVLIYESGSYNPIEAKLIKDFQTKVYEVKQGMKGEGATFHFALNSKIISDNRIPPRGFKNKTFKELGAAPMDAEYEDGQNWDESQYVLPDDTLKLEVKLLFQSTSKEYIEFLEKENYTNDWGKKVKKAWESTGRSRPVVIADTTITVK